MQVLRCMIIDDEPLPLELLSDYVQKTPFLQLQGAYSNPLEALTVVQSEPVDLIFLDIQMPEFSGLQFMQSLNHKCKVIFTSAYPDYAIQGYEFDVVDYLLKPVSFERFLKATTKALDNNCLPLPEVAGLEPLTVSREEKVLFVKTDYKIVKVVLSDILYIEGLKEYISIHISQGKVITLQTLKKMEDILPALQFTRVHKSFIVAIDKIDSIERNRIFIQKNIIPVGDTYKESFLSLLNNKNLYK
jgi:two-component system, LytTR family, response regulator